LKRTTMKASNLQKHVGYGHETRGADAACQARKEEVAQHSAEHCTDTQYDYPRVTRENQKANDPPNVQSKAVEANGSPTRFTGQAP